MRRIAVGLAVFVVACGSSSSSGPSGSGASSSGASGSSTSSSGAPSGSSTSSGGSSTTAAFGPDPDFDTIQAAFDHPDGTITASNLSSVLGVLTAPDNAYLPPLTGCDQSQTAGTCPCPSGGTYQWEREVITGQKTTARVADHACAYADKTIEGKVFTRQLVSNPAILHIFEYDMTTPAQTVHVDVQLLSDTNGARYSVKVADGLVTVAQSATTGAITIVDKTGTWTCTSQTGTSGTCAAPAGGTTLPFTL